VKADASASDRREQDFRLLIGREPFDPADRPPAAAAARQAGVQATIVQFRAALTKPDVDRLRAEYDLALDRYFPNLAYLERLAPETLERVRADFHVRTCISLDPALKLDPAIAELPSPPREFVATLFNDADAAAAEAALTAAGAGDVAMADGDAHFTLDDPAHLTEVATSEEILWIEPVQPLAVRNPNAQAIQSGTVGPNGNPIWDRGLHGEGQVINVIDDGPIPLDHCFFADPAVPQAGPSHRKIVSMVSESGAAPTDHATYVAGILAGDDRGNPGAHPHRGGAWAAKLAVNNMRDKRHPHLRRFFDLLDRGKRAGAFIHTNSWGLVQTGTLGWYNKDAQDADRFSWNNERHLVIAAGSNTLEHQKPDDNTSPLVPGVNAPPGTAKNTLCVAAAKAIPNAMERGSGVDGPTKDKRRKPEIMAVGCGFRTARRGTPCTVALDTQCATSFATPNAAAAAALVRQYFVEGWYPTGKPGDQLGTTPSGALIKAVLLNSTVDMTAERDGTTQKHGYPSNAEGWGLIRLNRALYFAAGPRKLLVNDIPRIIGMDSYSRRSHSLYVVSSNEQLKVTLVWTDPPPSEHGFQHPNRNLIEVDIEDPHGNEFMSNNFEFGVTVGDDPTRDLANNVHMFVFDAPAVGEWTVKLRTEAVQTDEDPRRLPYALVATGDLNIKRKFY